MSACSWCCSDSAYTALIDKRRSQDKKRRDPGKLPTRSVELEQYLVESAEEHAQALGLTLERYIGNALAVRMEDDPLLEEQRQIEEFLAMPGRREWLDSWRQKNALRHPPTMADIAAAQKAEDKEARYEPLKSKSPL